MDYSILTGFATRYMMTKKRTLSTILKQKDLNTIDGILMVLIDKHPDFSQEKIGEITLFDGASIARALKRLEASGFAERKVHPTNHRKKLVNLTPEGKEFLSKVKAADHKISDQLFEDVSEEDKKSLEEILTHVFNNFDKIDIPK
ncbi:MarR family winged helix-turn-helix transcriptional regulator [Companilactobacillus mishanensis]|uniref:MarR family transcriptional regulator n=1 Tax=Companilactobacillus mishanensis TaxID=2486008 RepID=A0ABW9P7Q9_9LACO|nr:MarR family transcriptional regulator [Companilactobacillus mishanensis]MQS44992.1 MarR family transcriptional regulator [Companilactobacillus mishanensis]